MIRTRHTLLLLAIVPVLCSQCTATRQLQQAERNKETVRLWWEEGWNNNRNEELLYRCFTPDWQDGNPLVASQQEGIEGIRRTVRAYREAFPDSKFTITHLFADHKHVAIRYEVIATHQGEMFGLAPTGREFTSTGLVLYEMRDGKIAVTWQELDLTGIINQLKN
ncbi:MAG: ester cyclase [Saprospiraceae bacterium]|nr:ester cyclase [Saprospiraceae bacterium]